MPPVDQARLPPDLLVDRLLASGLRGRGGGWFPAGRMWRAVRVEEGEPVVVANGAEGEPGWRHPDPFAPGSSERAAVEAAVMEQLS